MRGRYLDTHTDNHLSTSKLLRCPVAEIDKLRKLSRNKWRCKDALCIFCYASKWQIKNLLLKFLFAMHNFQLEQNRVKLRTAELEKGWLWQIFLLSCFTSPQQCGRVGFKGLLWKRWQLRGLQFMRGRLAAWALLSPLEICTLMYTNMYTTCYICMYITIYVCMYITIYVHYMYITLQPLEPHQIKWMLWELLFTMACM